MFLYIILGALVLSIINLFWTPKVVSEKNRKIVDKVKELLLTGLNKEEVKQKLMSENYTDKEISLAFILSEAEVNVGKSKNNKFISIAIILFFVYMLRGYLVTYMSSTIFNIIYGAFILLSTYGLYLRFTKNKK